jgi:hypothetical protein
VGIEPHLPKQTTASPKKRLASSHSTKSGERDRESSHRADLRALRHREQKNQKRMRLYSTCASPVVPHPSTGHAHGCLASEIGRDPAFPTRFDRTVSSPEVSLLTPSRHTIGRWEGTVDHRIERRERVNERFSNQEREKEREGIRLCNTHHFRTCDDAIRVIEKLKVLKG